MEWGVCLGRADLGEPRAYIEEAGVHGTEARIHLKIRFKQGRELNGDQEDHPCQDEIHDDVLSGLFTQDAVVHAYLTHHAGAKGTFDSEDAEA